ncbi:hydroxyethylthiazole kinase [Ornithinibacillus bavariensis]|uniref:hydroxyethylthiazole kinase n=1 Tax=Ornithinibacillus bavariensis TaxID=545502 RepID=UPI000EED0A7B|nr:hydroxyethylthiazole kinase [Ornithinibacillus sp.]
MNKTNIIPLFAKVREKQPLIHHITNNVTINDCANVTLAIGGSPVMATGIEEVADMAQLADALVINFGTIDNTMYQAMILAGQSANRKGIPVIFDPVGVGATRFRTELAREFIKKVKVTIVRGNASEIFSLVGGDAQTRGVDAGEISITKESLVLKAAQQLHAVTVISGKEDVISDGSDIITVENGDILLSRVTGTGCMTASLIACFAGAIDNPFFAAVAGMSVMSLAGELAREQLVGHEGLGTFRVKLMDEITNMSGEKWEARVRLT